MAAADSTNGCVSRFAFRDDLNCGRVEAAGLNLNLSEVESAR